MSAHAQHNYYKLDKDIDLGEVGGNIHLIYRSIIRGLVVIYTHVRFKGYISSLNLSQYLTIGNLKLRTK